MSKPKRFLVFWFAHYYPCGGWDDLEDSYDTLEEARGRISGDPTLLHGSWQIIDLETGEDVTYDR